MAACQFSIPFTGSPSEVINKAKAALQSQGGNFEGNEQGGNFDVTVFGSTIKGSFTVAGQNLEMIIDSKPFLLPCSTIESFLRNQLGQ